MPRKRMIDPSIWTDESFGELSERGRLLFIGLFSMADDEGRGEASAKVLKGKIFPYDEGLRVADVSKTLKEIGSKMSVDFYARNGREYYAFKNWRTWQKVEKPTQSRIPAPIDGGKGENYAFDDNSPTAPRMLPECSTTVPRPIEQNRIEEVSMYEKKENITSIACAHARESRESYRDILNDNGVSAQLQRYFWNFIKHCQLNGRKITNDKLLDIIVRLDMQYGTDDTAKANSLKKAVNKGYFDIAEEL